MNLTRRDMLAATALAAASAVMPSPASALSPEFERLNRAFGEAIDAYRAASQAHAADVPSLMREYRSKMHGKIGWYMRQPSVAARQQALIEAQTALDRLLIEMPRSDAERALQHAAIDLAEREFGDRSGQTRRHYAMFHRVAHATD